MRTDDGDCKSDRNEEDDYEVVDPYASYDGLAEEHDSYEHVDAQSFLHDELV